MKKVIFALLTVMCAAGVCSGAQGCDPGGYNNDPNLAKAMEYDGKMERDKAVEYYQKYLKREDLPSSERARIFVHLAARYTTESEPALPRMKPDPQKAKAYLEKALEVEPERIGHTTIRARTLLASLPIYSREEQIRRDMEVYAWLLSINPEKIEKLALPEAPGETGLSDLRRKSILNYVESLTKATAFNIMAEARSMSDDKVWFRRIVETFPDSEAAGMAAKELAAMGDIGVEALNQTVAVQPSSWEAGPGIRVNGVWKAHKQEWFHVSQSCNLTIDAVDKDTLRDNGRHGGNHVLGSRCLWYGANLSRYSGLSVTWQPQHWTEGDRIYAVVDDDPELPGASATDDGAVRTPLVILKAWEAMVFMTGQTTTAGTTKAEVVTETGHGGTARAASIVCSLAKGPIIASTGDRGRDGTPMVNGRRHEYLSLMANGTWSLNTIPQNAQRVTATGKFKVSASMSGELITQTQDDDWDLFRSDYAKVTGASCSIDIKEGCESAAGLGFVFYSDILDHSPDTCKIEDDSGNGSAKPNSVKYSHDDTKWSVGEFGMERKAFALVGGSVEAKGDARRRSSASISVTGSCKYSCSEVSAENLYLSDEPELVRAK